MDAENLAFAVGEGSECLGSEAAQRLAPAAAGLDEAGGAEPADVPADERLRQPDVVHELRHAGLAPGEPLHDAQAVHVGERLVDDAQLAEVIGLVDDRGERRPDPGAGGAQGYVLASTAVYITES